MFMLFSGVIVDIQTSVDGDKFSHFLKVYLGDGTLLEQYIFMFYTGGVCCYGLVVFC